MVYLDESLIKTLTKIAVDQDINVCEIVEEASRRWLDNNGPSGTRTRRK